STINHENGQLESDLNTGLSIIFSAAIAYISGGFANALLPLTTPVFNSVTGVTSQVSNGAVQAAANAALQKIDATLLTDATAGFHFTAADQMMGTTAWTGYFTNWWNAAGPPIYQYSTGQNYYPDNMGKTLTIVITTLQ
ncbi:MAG TPA: hypothetical protein VGM92_12395, partial [Candidatus Kapabacteria bacterium]